MRKMSTGLSKALQLCIVAIMLQHALVFARPNPGVGRSLLQASKVVVVYAGAYPAGQPPPDLNQIPSSDSGVDVYVALAFAREANGAGTSTDGNFDFYDGIKSSFTPESIAAIQEATGNKFMAALAGDSSQWGQPVDGWVDAAVTSLVGLVDAWGLDGIDVNYEGSTNNWDGFVDNMCAALTQVKEQRPDIVVSVAPFGATNSVYSQLWSTCGDGVGVDWVNYQVYADGPTNPADTESYMRDNVAPSYGGSLDNVAVGFASSLTSPRGVAPADSVVVMQDLASEVKGAMVWSLEDSAAGNDGYAAINGYLNALSDG